MVFNHRSGWFWLFFYWFSACLIMEGNQRIYLYIFLKLNLKVEYVSFFSSLYHKILVNWFFSKYFMGTFVNNIIKWIKTFTQLLFKMKILNFIIYLKLLLLFFFNESFYQTLFLYRYLPAFKRIVIKSPTFRTSCSHFGNLQKSPST